MTSDAMRALEDAIEHCLTVKEILGPHTSSQTKLLLDMLLLNLGRDLIKAAAKETL